MLRNKSLKFAGLALVLMLAVGCQQVPTEKSAVQTQRPATNVQQRQAQAEQTVITVHLAQKNSEPTLVTVDLGGNNKLYALSQPILTQADMRQVTPVTAENGSTYIMFDMTPEGRAKLANISSQALGHFFLISAKGQLISVAQIGEPMTDGKLLISTNGSEHTRQVLQLLR